jgi:methylornithine synthase
MKNYTMIRDRKTNVILEKALAEKPLTKNDIIHLLSVEDQREMQKLFEVAKLLRARYFNDSIYLYGFLYFSTFCLNECTFCINRVSNLSVLRYRKDKSAIIDACRYLKSSGIHCIDLTMGEDPLFYQNDKGVSYLREIVRGIKKEADLPLMISPGALSKSALADLAGDGVEWYACYQECHNPSLFQKLRPGQDYGYRLNIKYFAKELGLLVEEGILTGVGEKLEDIADSFIEMGRLGAQQVRVMRFIPCTDVPLKVRYGHSRKSELIAIGILRLLFPDRLIPASLDIDGIKTLQKRLEAGANVITSLVPPFMGFSGVAQPSLDINEGNRSVEKVLPILKKCGLEPASLEDYILWIKSEKKKMRATGHLCQEVCG